jgi:hypothetical protein
MVKYIKSINIALLVSNCFVTLALAFGIGDPVILRPAQQVLNVGQMCGKEAEKQLMERKEQ